MARYKYEVEGRGRNDQTWSVSGYVSTMSQGDFAKSFHLAMQDAFRHLTEGRAVYGKPGQGCFGPYTITKFTLEEES